MATDGTARSSGDPAPRSTRRLAEFVTSTRLEDVPEATRREAKRAILDNLGVALGAADDPGVAIARRVALELGGSPQATLWADGRRTSVTHAALVNGIMSHILDYDDTHLPTILHPSGPLVNAAIPVAEWRGSSGRDVLAAYVLGFEVEARVSLSVYPEHYDVGWHITGTAGTLGAAAASAEAAANSAIPPMKTPRRPRMSATRPSGASSAAKATAYAVTFQLSVVSDVPGKSRSRSGKATLTTVTSR
jgi:2-methylcitrate dehydratase PrpD